MNSVSKNNLFYAKKTFQVAKKGGKIQQIKYK